MEFAKGTPAAFWGGLMHRSFDSNTDRPWSKERPSPGKKNASQFYFSRIGGEKIYFPEGSNCVRMDTFGAELVSPYTYRRKYRVIQILAECENPLS